MINDATAMILEFQTAYEAREQAKSAYHREPTEDNTKAYAEALLNWDAIWQEMVAWHP